MDQRHPLLGMQGGLGTKSRSTLAFGLMHHQELAFDQGKSHIIFASLPCLACIPGLCHIRLSAAADADIVSRTPASCIRRPYRKTAY